MHLFSFRLYPGLIADQLFLRQRYTFQACDLCAFKRVVREGDVLLFDLQNFGTVQRRIRHLGVKKKIFISRKVPNGIGTVLLDGQNSEKGEAALKLKYKKVAGGETVNWLHMLSGHHKY